MIRIRGLIFLFLLFSVNLDAQSFDKSDFITFTSVGLDEGLSQSTVFSIDQDNRGNMWFATYDGVNKYDGYSFTVYQHNTNDTGSIASDITRVLKVDSKGRVWIGTREGLSFYNEEKDVFKNFFYSRNGKNVQIIGIAEINDNLLLLGTDRGLLTFDINNSQFADNTLDKEVHKLLASAIYRNDNIVYIGTKNGLYTYSITEAKLSLLTSATDGKRIQCILQQSADRIWIGTEGAGLFMLNPVTKEVKNYRHKEGDPNSLSSDYIRSIAIDGQNRLWVGTFNDLNIYKEAKDSFVSYGSNPVVRGSLSQNSIRRIFKDSQGGMWLGTYYGGLNYYHPLKNRFNNIRHIPYQNSLNDNVVNYIAEDKNRNLWIGTNDGGINYYNTTTNVFKSYALQKGRIEGVSSNNVKVIHIDDDAERVFVGAHAGGLKVFYYKTGRIEHYHPLNSELIDESIYAIIPTKNNNLWLGTLNTMVKFDLKKKTFTSIMKERDGSPFVSRRIAMLFRDSKQRIWTGGEGGLRVYDEMDEQLQTVRVIPDSMQVNNAFINCMLEASDGVFWIGTRDGVYGYDETSKRLKHYTKADMLPNNVVYGIIEDSSGNLWMSTNRGLSCFNPKTEKFRNYIGSDNMRNSQFNSQSYCRASSGDLYFGGINGIITFKPEELVDNPYTPSVVITNLQLFNKTVRPDDDTGLLSKNIADTESLTFKSSQSSFSLEFVVSNYIAGQNNTFAYKLEGYDKEWYQLTDKRSVSYSNLPHGDYCFFVKAANNDGKWNEKPTALKITILPVWYRTWWATVLFCLGFVAIAIFIFRFFWVRKSMKAQLEMERIDKERREEVNEMKMRFFINISHELRTPLSLILAPLHEVMDRVGDRWIRKQLRYVQRNTNRLLHLVNQLMDYRRAELGVFQLKVRQGDANKLISENYLSYENLAQSKNIDYMLESEIEGKEMIFDSDYLELIINNLLSNAFKYTDEGGSITVRLKQEENNLLLQVSDTGIGISAEQQGKVFDRFYQVSAEYAGSGVGLSLVQRLVELHHGRIQLFSEEGKGSVFSVYIPQNESVYLSGELDLESANSEEVRAYSINSKDSYITETEEVELMPDKSLITKRGSILVVEDNEEIRKYLSEGLSGLFHIIEAENGEVAVEMLKDNEIDIVVTDVMMPVMDGINLTRYIKQNIRLCHIPVFILSAKTDLKDQLDGLRIGADDYIPKPFSISVLKTKIQNSLRTRQRVIDRYSKNLEIEPEAVTFNPLDEELLKRAVSIVEKNMDNVNFSVEDFAKEMEMSRTGLHMKLKALTGESTNDLILKIRFKKACDLLKDGRNTVSEISYMSGFRSPSYFTTSFKKYFGFLPTDYVKNQGRK